MSGISDSDGNPLIPDGNDLILGQFEVAVPGVTLMNAVDLGKLGLAPIEVPGALDFQTASHGVSLYRIHLDPGHFWRLGLEVTAQRDGGTLDTALALFDDQGRPIATDEVGRKDAPKDPYLFAGLNPGTYYVGVSGVNNLPGPKGATIRRPDPPGRCRRLRTGAPIRSTSSPTPWIRPPSSSALLSIMRTPSDPPRPA